MLQLTPQTRILLATEPVDFRKGIDGLAAVYRRVLLEQPLSGTVFVFRNRAGTALKLLMDDGQGFWLCTKRLSHGRFPWWPTGQDASAVLSARALAIVLWNGNSQQAGMAEDWKQLASGPILVGAPYGSLAGLRVPTGIGTKQWGRDDAASGAARR